MAIEPSCLGKKHHQPIEPNPTTDHAKNNNTMLPTLGPAPEDGAVDSIVSTNTSPAPTEAEPINTSTNKFQNTTPQPGRTVDGLMEAPDRSDAVEPRASDHSRPGPAFGCREGVFQAPLSGEYTGHRTIAGPDVPSPNRNQPLCDVSDDDESTDDARQLDQALALQWNICGLSTRYAELELPTHSPHLPVFVVPVWFAPLGVRL